MGNNISEILADIYQEEKKSYDEKAKQSEIPYGDFEYSEKAKIIDKIRIRLYKCQVGTDKNMLDVLVIPKIAEELEKLLTPFQNLYEMNKSILQMTDDTNKAKTREQIDEYTLTMYDGKAKDKLRKFMAKLATASL